ncbi:MAG: helix-turn-helix transcriptional regulator [Deltaproteobacteria bacterium]|nr:helix-turn-helix transcriptional regulator [Deltaproteobacteria bacterium]
MIFLGTFSERITFLIDFIGNEYNLTQNAIAELIGIKGASLSGLKSGKSSQPSRSTVLAFQQKFGVNPAWLNTGEGDPFEPNFDRETVLDSQISDQFTYIPYFDLSAEAGGGRLIEDESVKKYLAFRTDWIKSSLRVSPKDLALMDVQGNSMEPTLQNRDLMLIDCSQVNILNGKVYTFRRGESLLVKRLEILVNGDIVIKSDNPEYEKTIVKPDYFNEIEIIGRVVWFGREL